MKKIFIELIILFFAAASVFAADETASPQPTVSDMPAPTKAVTDKIQELKDRVANRVAALNKEKLAGLTGTVKSISDSALILISNSQEYSIQTDEETKVFTIDSNLRKKEVKLSEIEKEKTVTIIGTVNKDEKTAIARMVVEKEPNVLTIGKVASVSTKEGTVTLLTTEGKTIICDIEINTKSNYYDPQKAALVKIGLSKIEEGSPIHVFGNKGTEENRITALRLLLLPKEISGLVIPSITPEITASATPKPTSAKTPALLPTQ